MRVLIALVGLLLGASSAQAAVTYTLTVNSTQFGGFTGTAALSLPRYLVQPDPPAFRNYAFTADQLDSCTLMPAYTCNGVQLSALQSFTGDYVVTGTIDTSFVGFGVIFPTARLDANGTYSGSLGDTLTGQLVISGEPTFIPEPATWAMMIAGLGATGGCLRRRRTMRLRAAG